MTFSEVGIVLRSDFQAEYEGSIPFTRSSLRSQREGRLPRRSPAGEGGLVIASDR